MSATLLQIVQQAAVEMNLALPASVIGNTTQDVQQLYYLTNAVGYEVQREFEWQKMTQIYQFSTPYLTTTGTVADGSAVITAIPDTSTLSTDYQVSGVGINNPSYILSVDSATQVTMSQEATASGTAQSLTFSKVKFAFPSGFDRVIDRTDWDKTQHWEMLGPETPQQWEWLTSGYISTGPRVRFRLLAGKFQIWPALASEHLLGFEYQSNNWIYSAAAAAAGSQPDKASFTVDTDQCIFPDRIMVIGLKKKFFEVKGMNVDAFTRDYMTQLSIAKAADAGSPTLSFAPKPGSVLITWNNIPDAGYGT